MSRSRNTPDSPTGERPELFDALRAARREVAAAQQAYRKADEAGQKAMGHLLRVWPDFPRVALREEAGGTRRLHYRLLDSCDQRGDEEIPLWEITEQERRAAFSAAVVAVRNLLESKRGRDLARAKRQEVVVAVRSATRDTIPLTALVEPSGLSYQRLLQIDRR